MSNQRLINMAFRMLMRFGTKWLSQRGGTKTDAEGNVIKTPAQNAGTLAKRLRSLKRLTRL